MDVELEHNCYENEKAQKKTLVCNLRDSSPLYCWDANKTRLIWVLLVRLLKMCMYGEDSATDNCSITIIKRINIDI
ncbi:hypothetical protein H5410_001609 [Solanum commersonii]|uniref:Uncharacterized protein n=1 Tax=Solanum commersonii TaxID=4109 RepID=A0A9J6AZM8_SOLCO|nr:hypothetical protein H5410_001609 [Solanum commersonii]